MKEWCRSLAKLSIHDSGPSHIFRTLKNSLSPLAPKRVARGAKTWSSVGLSPQAWVGDLKQISRVPKHSHAARATEKYVPTSSARFPPSSLPLELLAEAMLSPRFAVSTIEDDAKKVRNSQHLLTTCSIPTDSLSPPTGSGRRKCSLALRARPP